MMSQSLSQSCIPERPHCVLADWEQRLHREKPRGCEIDASGPVSWFNFCWQGHFIPCFNDNLDNHNLVTARSALLWL